MKTTVRIGAVPYLNAVPLVYALEQSACIPYELTYAEPSLLAEHLREGDLDVGLIPVMEYLSGVGACIVPDASISSWGRARSVKLFSKKPWEQVRVVAAHSASRSSAALAKVLLQEQYGHEVELRRTAPDIGAVLSEADAVLLIGDPCLAAREALPPHVADLGTVWHTVTGLPFVYAVWACASEQPAKGLAQTLVAAKQRGVASISEIAHQEDGRAGLSEGEIDRYLRVDLNYDLTPAHIEGIRAFAELCVRHGLLEAVREVRFPGDE